MNFLDLIKSDGYITVSKELAREIGLQETIILSELISQYEYFKDRGELDKEGYFYCTANKMEKNTTILKKTQSRKINNLIKLGLIEKEVKGLPAKRHFKINEEEILKLFFDKNPDNPRQLQVGQNDQTSKVKSTQQERSNRTNINNNNYDNYKTEEEEAAEIPQKIQSKFQQIFNRKLSVEFYQKITKIYSDPNIILKALSICEQQADKPKYLLTILQDWQDNELESVSSINAYLENRQAQRAFRQSEKKTTATRPETPEEELQRLYEKGYR